MKNYFDFKGTAKRQEYWAVLIASIVAGIIGIVITETIPLVALIVLVATLWVYISQQLFVAYAMLTCTLHGLSQYFFPTFQLLLLSYLAL